MRATRLRLGTSRVPLKFAFVTGGQIVQSNGRLSSPLASARYRVILPAEQLARSGHPIELMTAAPANFLQVNAQALAGVDAVVISKVDPRGWPAVMRQLQQSGRRVVVDVCDNDFDSLEIAVEFTALVRDASQLVAATTAMAEVIAQRTGRQADVVSDPVEGPRGEPRFEPRWPALRCLWFGHHTNLDSLLQSLEQLRPALARMPIDLRVLTTPVNDAEQAAARLSAPFGGRLSLSFAPWSVDATWDELKQCDVVLLPSLQHQGKMVKSPNRLLEALWAGRPVVAHPIPAYAHWQDEAFVGTDLSAQLERLFGAAATDVLQRIAAAQRRIAAGNSPYAIGRRWAQCLAGSAAAAVRLNLGCGDKILPGFVNVDVVPSRRGQRPDLLCDLRDLSMFDDNSVDEILSVHVVEHFWRWEVEDILREWVRVLKPGAPMVIECPNLQSACEEFLKALEARARPDAEGQLTMWVFYGDPQWQDPYMVHRWGYTPQSLRALLEGVGLTQIQQTPAQFKLREPRDMRVVGLKRKQE